MNITSKEARDIFDSKNYVVLRNYIKPLDVSLFKNIYDNKMPVIDSHGYDYSSMHPVPRHFFENESVVRFYDECVSIYKDPNTFYAFSVPADTTERHSDLADVIHWQCSGTSEWVMYEGLVAFGDERKNIEKKSETIKLHPGDVIWFKAGQEHMVVNLESKYSIIFMSNTDLKNFISKKYAEAGMSFESAN